jgi:hypothetical protein
MKPQLLMPVAALLLAAGPPLSQQPNPVLIELKDPILVLGEGPPEAYLYHPIDYVAGNGDTIYVLDFGAKEVVAFGGSGERLFSFGRQGQGPGEFELPTHLGYKQRTVYVLDRQINRLILFNSQGRLKHSIQLDQSPRDFARSTLTDSESVRRCRCPAVASSSPQSVGTYLDGRMVGCW